MSAELGVEKALFQLDRVEFPTLGITTTNGSYPRTRIDDARFSPTFTSKRPSIYTTKH